MIKKQLIELIKQRELFLLTIYHFILGVTIHFTWYSSVHMLFQLI